MRPSVTSPTGTVIGPPVSTHLGAARQAVGGVHRHRADAVVAEVLLHLAARALPPSPRSIVERGVDLGQLVGEHGLDDDALDLLDPPDVGVLPLESCCSDLDCCHPSRSSSWLRHSASAPATTSMISWVISACRARFISSVRSSMMSPGVLRRVAHGRHARAVLGRGRLQQRAEDRDLDVVGDEPLEDLLRVGLVLDERVLASCSSRLSLPRVLVALASRIVACCSGSSVSRRTSWVSGEM